MTTSRATLRVCAVAALAAIFAALLILPVEASATPPVGWAIHAVAEPTSFSSDDSARCEVQAACDRYQLLVMNVGSESSSGPVTLTDKLPVGLSTIEETMRVGPSAEGGWSCSEGVGQTTVTCTLEESIAPGHYAPFLDVWVSAPSDTSPAQLRNEVTVEGGGASSTATTSDETLVDSARPPFGVDEFAFEPAEAGGTPSSTAAGHPWEITVDAGVPLVFNPPGVVEADPFQPAQNIKSASVTLPLGLVGNPQAVPRCTEAQLRVEECPEESRVGALAVILGDSPGEFGYSNMPVFSPPVSAIYNVVPEGGYPAEFGFTYERQTVFLYASVVHTALGYRLRITAPGLPSAVEPSHFSITFFGDPRQITQGESGPAFLTNPSDCSAGALSSEIELRAWESPYTPATRDATAYPPLTGCGLLQFHPTFTFGPSPSPEEGTAQVDSPSAYTLDLTTPHTTAFSERATPNLKDASVTLPAGVAVSPSAATGLVGCMETGSDGINIGSSEVATDDNDLGDPEATELGSGDDGGDGSRFDDGFYHVARGHCPAAATLGTVELTTPLLEKPIRGHLYLAEPKCGGEGQQACTEASAANGELFGVYLELGGEPGEETGVIIKLRGSVSANPSTGHLTVTFANDPELPFNDLIVHLHGGPRAALANPQSCGTYAASSDFTPWSTPETPDATPPASSFAVGGCESLSGFAPSFSAGTFGASAGAASPFRLAFSRRDGEPDFSGITETMPPGLLGMLAQVVPCSEPQAAQGTCSGASRIGSATVLAGAGPQPFPAGGEVFLTGPYDGAPFGLSVVVSAKAGPFNLGDVVVRAAITVDPNTTAVTVSSSALPQIRDGVPFRIKTIDVLIERPGFIVNPTNCAQQSIDAEISGADGEKADVSSPFAVNGCSSLPFKPSLVATTQAKTSKVDGASLDVRVSQGSGEAHIRKVDLQLPRVLPSRLTTLQKACTDIQFAANPAGCPEGSVIGTAIASTPVLNAPLTGPAYLVSHGGAAFPDIEFVLQVQGVTVLLDGKTDIKGGVTYSHFETLPDAPISFFEAALPEGTHSVLTASGSLCAQSKVVKIRRRVTRRIHGHKRQVVTTTTKIVAQPLVMATKITGQNNAVVNQTTKIVVTGCPRTKQKTRVDPAKKTPTRRTKPARSRSRHH
jgi:hypothetical protein